MVILLCNAQVDLKPWFYRIATSQWSSLPIWIAALLRPLSPSDDRRIPDKAG